MTDTKKHIKEIQLKIWLSKTPEERLLQFLKDNEAMYLAINALKQQKNSPFTNSSIK